MRTPMRRRIDWKRRLIVGTVLLVAAGAFWWVSLRTEYWEPGLRLSYETGGTPRAVTFFVTDELERPVPFVVVNCRGRTGWSTRQMMTDGYGRAILSASEDEVWGVKVGDREVVFRRGTLNRDWFGPSCADGMTVRVVLTTE